MARQIFDEGYKETEDILGSLEDDIAKEYKRANDEIIKKYEDYLKQFSKADEEQRKLFEAGKISEKDYEDWRFRHIAMNERWREMRETIAEDYYNVDKISKQMSSNVLPDVYAVNHNYSNYEIMHDGKLNYSFTLYNHRTVERLMRDNPKMLPEPGAKVSEAIERGEAIRWNEKQIQSSIMQSIISGENIVDAAHRLETVTEKNFNAALRNARTAITGAQSAGRQDAYEHARDIGVKIKKMWMATLDDRTRHEHRILHGQTVDIDKPFEVYGDEIMNPGDPSADAYLVYNCRCCTRSVVEGHEGDLVTSSPKMGDMTYEEWKEGGTRKEREDESPDETKSVLSGEELYKSFGEIPDRPRRSDYDDYDDFKQARLEYQEAKEEVRSNVESWYDQNYGGKPMNDEELSNWCEKNDVVVNGSLDGLDREILTAYTERYEKLIEDFPVVHEWHERIERPFEISYDPNSLAEATGGFGMQFCRMGHDYKESCVTSVISAMSGETVIGENPALQTFDHEFGHQLFFSITNWGFESSPQQFREIQDMRKDFLTSCYGKQGMSEYATTNEDELFAEAFSAWYGGNQTEFAKAFGDFLGRHGII